VGKVVVQAIGLSVDGFAAGPNQSLENPLGERGGEIMRWFFPTQVFQGMYGKGTGETGVDNDMAAESMAGKGAWILGRNMFGPVRGPWPDETWKGWWGDEPSYHVPTFVLTHYKRDPVEMKGGTVFYFVTGGISEALELAKDAAGDKDVRIGGGAATIRQSLQAGFVDEMHVAVSPVVMGNGEKLFEGLDLRALGYECSRSVMGERAMHVFLTKR
jgi:dihydrofolate reductase